MMFRKKSIQVNTPKSYSKLQLEAAIACLKRSHFIAALHTCNSGLSSESELFKRAKAIIDKEPVQEFEAMYRRSSNDFGRDVISACDPESPIYKDVCQELKKKLDRDDHEIEVMERALKTGDQTELKSILDRGVIWLSPWEAANE